MYLFISETRQYLIRIEWGYDFRINFGNKE